MGSRKRQEFTDVPELKDHKILGFDSHGFVHPGDTVEVYANPQIPFKGDRLHVEYKIARYFDVLGIRVGNRSVCISGDSVPADVFSLEFTTEKIKFQKGARLDFRVCEIGMQIAIQVRNKYIHPVVFKAALLGRITR